MSSNTVAKQKQYRLVLERRSYIVLAITAGEAFSLHDRDQWGERCCEVQEVKQS